MRILQWIITIIVANWLLCEFAWPMAKTAFTAPATSIGSNISKFVMWCAENYHFYDRAAHAKVSNISKPSNGTGH